MTTEASERLTDPTRVFSPMPQYRITCEICGQTTLVATTKDCQVWIDKDDYGSFRHINVCPEHKAKFLRLVSDFVEGI